MYNQAFADYATDFIECLKHGDDFYGSPFLLLEWQKTAISNFYGTLRDEQYRQYQYLYLEIPKKNGKSELAAALGLFHTFADESYNGEVYCVAADRDNASIVFNAALSMINQNRYLSKRTRSIPSLKKIIDKETGTVFKVLSSEAYSKHGYKPTCVIFDELHAQRNRELWDIMTFGSGSARKQPVYIVLTTAGDDPDRHSIGWEIHKKAKSILEYRQGKTEGNYDNPQWLPYIFSVGDDEESVKGVDIFDEELWYRCNPSLGHTIQIETLRNEALDARQSEASERLFRWLRLNQWIALKTVGWLPLTLYDENVLADFDINCLLGLKCYGGLDLSSTTDLTDFSLLFPPQIGLEFWVFLDFAFMPQDNIVARSREDKVPYIEWSEKGYINATAGDCVDFDIVENTIYEAASKYVMKSLGVDPYLSRSITQHLLEKDINVVEIPQNMVNMSPPMKELEKGYRQGKVKHFVNPVGRWCFGNVRCCVDGNENIKPMKNKSTGRIDIIVGRINAKAAAMLDMEFDINDVIMSGEWKM